jgi:protein-S-isoprenylcysteine O-methyltransferase Ste14
MPVVSDSQTLPVLPHTANRAARSCGIMPGITLAGLCGFVGAWTVGAVFPHVPDAVLLAGFIVFCGGAMVWARIDSQRKVGSDVFAALPAPSSLARVAQKMFGLWGTLVILAIAFALIPEYKQAFYRPVWDMAIWLVVPMIIVTFVYMTWLDRRMENPHDGYWHAGLLLRGKFSRLDWPVLREHALGWLVKGFFLPLMLAGAAAHYRVLVDQGIVFATFGELYSSTLNLLFALDVTFGAIGYLLTLRILGSHIRSVDRTWIGWISTICCYVPFSYLIWGTVLGYEGRTSWDQWLSNYPVLLISWGLAILLLHVVYVWATCSFGICFSNLTNRGVVTHGPYRYVKHPAYLSKNIAWWLMAVPFVVDDSVWETVRRCVCLALTNGIYVVRAWTEERHLGTDPDYQAYSAWIEQHGFAAQIRRWWGRS